MASPSDKSRGIAFILAMVLGVFGAHRFYVGKNGTGILMICTLGGIGIWYLYDVIMVASGQFTDAEGRRLVRWDPEDLSPHALEGDLTQEVLEDVEALRREVAELSERLDFTERLLMKGGEEAGGPVDGRTGRYRPRCVSSSSVSWFSACFLLAVLPRRRRCHGRTLCSKAGGSRRRWSRGPGPAPECPGRSTGSSGPALVISSSGCNVVPVEMAEGFQKRGLKVVVIISHRHSEASPSKLPSGKKLQDFADVVLDTGAPPGDAMVRIPGLATPVSPGSTVGGCLLVNAIKAEVAARLTAAGQPPLVLSGAAVVGPEQAIQIFEAAYDEHSRRLARLYKDAGT